MEAQRVGVGLCRDPGGVIATQRSYDGMTMASGLRVGAFEEQRAAVKRIEVSLNRKRTL